MNEETRASKIITLLVSLLLLALLIIVHLPQAHAGQNWCGDWKEGFAIGYCWTRKECTYIPPQFCPYPEDDQQDGYIVGLRDGMATKEPSE